MSKTHLAIVGYARSRQSLTPLAQVLLLAVFAAGVMGFAFVAAQPREAVATRDVAPATPFVAPEPSVELQPDCNPIAIPEVATPIVAQATPVVAPPMPVAQRVERALVRLRMTRESAATLVEAAAANGCASRERLALLLAIRRHENGGPGFEWGCVPVRGRGYAAQAACAARTVSRFLDKRADPRITRAAVDALGRKYCPVDRTIIWQRNVWQWYTRALTALDD